MEKEPKKKRSFIIIIILAIVLLGGAYFFKDQILNIFNKQDKEKTITYDINEVKTYLEANYDKFYIDGSTSTTPLHKALNERFSKEEDKTPIHNKTVDAFTLFAEGKRDILFSVDFSDEVLSIAKKKDVDTGTISITREGFVFLINKKNPVKSLTIEQIKDIYSGKITNWKQVGGDDAPIKAFQRNSDSGSQMRMEKFMGSTKLMDAKKEYIIEGMGALIEEIDGYDEGKYSIGYNMYTFTEKQYQSEDVTLLQVNGVTPTDETIFNEEYPVVIYNYIYYDKNNKLNTEFAKKLHFYLMSEEGQKLISDAGYINLNKKLDRNKTVDDHFQGILEYEIYNQTDFNMYNEAKGEFYAIKDMDYETGKGTLVVYKNYPDYVLRDTKHKDNKNAREYLEKIFKSDMPLHPGTVSYSEESGIIMIMYWFGGGIELGNFFNIKYDGKYYEALRFDIATNTYLLKGGEKELLDQVLEYEDKNSDFYKQKDLIVLDKEIEISNSDLKKLEFKLDIYDKDNNKTYEYHKYLK